MSNTATMPCASTIAGDLPETVARRAFAWSAVLFLAGLVLLGLLQYQGHQALQQNQGGLRADSAGLELQFGEFVLRIALVTVGCGAALLLTVGIGVLRWRRTWTRQMAKAEESWREKHVALQVQIEKSRKSGEYLTMSQAELTEQLNQFKRQAADLQQELDSRKKAERTLSQQRQVLESSKTVLELHVQASTEEIHNLKRRYELILNSAGEGICGLDLNGKATFVNPAAARMTGWSVEDLIGKTEQDLFGAPGAESSTRDSKTGEQSFCRKDGSRFPVEFVRTSIEENGRPTGAVLIFKDITERQRASETLSQRAAELARSNAELEQFAFVASHDLQEPLRKIQSFGDRLRTKLGDQLPADASDYLQRMQNASARMRTLIDDLLTFSRVIRSSAPFEPVNLAQVTHEVLGDLEVRIEKTGARIETSNLPTVEADPTQMRQLVLNLVNNSLKFQPAGGRPFIQIRGRTFQSAGGAEYAEITVQDNGIGFDEHYTEKMFAVFQRLHGRGEYEGTGVGLAVCRRITDRHHGTITAHSQPGQGATFVVTLPLHHSTGEKKP
jgi:PAS domain S-box-containing protein